MIASVNCALSWDVGKMHATDEIFKPWKKDWAKNLTNFTWKPMLYCFTGPLSKLNDDDADDILTGNFEPGRSTDDAEVRVGVGGVAVVRSHVRFAVLVVDHLEEEQLSARQQHPVWRRVLVGRHHRKSVAIPRDHRRRISFRFAVERRRFRANGELVVRMFHYSRIRQTRVRLARRRCAHTKCQRTAATSKYFSKFLVFRGHDSILTLSLLFPGQY